MTTSGTPREFAKWIRLGMGHVLKAQSEHRFSTVAAIGRGRPLRRLPGRLQRRFREPAHHHPLPEVCLILEGHGVLKMGGGYCELRPPGLALVEAEVLHSEGHWADREECRLLWIIPRMSGHCGFNVSYCDDRGRWSVPDCFHFRSTSATTSLNRLANRDGDELSWDAIRADLLVILAEGLREAIRRIRQPETSNPASPTPLIDQITAYLQTNLSHDICVDDIADMVGLNRDYLGRLFRRSTGMSLYAFLTHKRMESAMELCRESDLAVKQIALGLGYRDPLYFSRAFRRFHGMSPLQARHGEGARPSG